MDRHQCQGHGHSHGGPPPFFKMEPGMFPPDFNPANFQSPMIKTGKFTFHYFNGIGRGEPIRWMFAYSNTPFEDRRYEGPEWPSVKASMPIQRLPVLEWNSNDGSQKRTLSQRDAIIRHLARLLGLFPFPPFEAGPAADEAFECLKDFEDVLRKAIGEKDEAARQQLLNQLQTDIEPRLLKYLEKKLADNGGKSIVSSNGPVYVDIFLASLFDLAGQHPFIEVHKSCPGLAALAQTIADSPGVKAYLATRPKINQ